MKIKVLNEVLNYENKIDQVDTLIVEIQKLLNDENIFFSHMVIDNEEIYEQFEDYIKDNIDRIQVITVIVKSIKEFVVDLLISLNSYTERVIPLLDNLGRCFYNNVTDEEWGKLEELLEGLQWTLNTIESIDQSTPNITNWEYFIDIKNQIETELPSFFEAISNKDTILIGDIIQYEVIPLYKKLNKDSYICLQEFEDIIFDE